MIDTAADGVIAGFTRTTRAELTEVLTSEFMLLARAKGLTKWQATVRHALKNAMVPIFPSILAEFIGILGGSMILESLYGIPGIGKSIEACDYLGGAPTGQKVIIIGGGLSGCEIAYDLYLKGRTPVIVEMKNDLVAVKGVCLANSSYLRDFFELNKVEVHLETKLKEFTDNGVKVVDKDGKVFDIEGDTVITSMGYRPHPLFAQKGKVRLVGDCNSVGNLRTAIWRAWDVAMKI